MTWFTDVYVSILITLYLGCFPLVIHSSYFDTWTLEVSGSCVVDMFTVLMKIFFHLTTLCAWCVLHDFASYLLICVLITTQHAYGHL